MRSNQFFVANRACEILEYTSVNQWNHVAIKDNPADAGPVGMSAEVLQLSSSINCPFFLANSSFPFVPNNDVIINIKLGEAERRLQYLVQVESFETEREDLFHKKSGKQSSRIAPYSPFLSPNGLICSSGRIKRLIDFGFNVK